MDKQYYVIEYDGHDEHLIYDDIEKLRSDMLNYWVRKVQGWYFDNKSNWCTPAYIADHIREDIEGIMSDLPYIPENAYTDYARFAKEDEVIE